MNEEFTYSEENSTLGDRIEAARQMKEMSRDELAERLGVKKSTIRKWENDQSEPRSNRLYMMAGVLDCNVMWILNGEGDSPLAQANIPIEQKMGALKAELADLRADLNQITRRITSISEKL